uniref:Antitermination protein n=1 Tax=Ascaris lumbricoides TaxID=6252 RepID=A0A0M3I2U8_ASCLU
MERGMESINKMQHTTNEELRSGSALKDIVEEMYERRLRWTGHVARLNDCRWASKSLSGNQETQSDRAADRNKMARLAAASIWSFLDAESSGS